MVNIKTYYSQIKNKNKSEDEKCGDSILIDESNMIFAVADGFGNYDSQASSCAINYIKNNTLKTLQKDDIKGSLEQLLEQTNQKVIKEKEKFSLESYEDFGTTLDLAIIIEDKLYTAHVGDSRISGITNNEDINILTGKNTTIADQLNKKEYNKYELNLMFRLSNSISDFLGTPDCDIKIDEYDIDNFSKILLYTDGMKYISTDRILDISNDYQSDMIADRLTNESSQKPSKDVIDSYLKLKKNKDKKQTEDKFSGSDDCSVILIDIIKDKTKPNKNKSEKKYNEENKDKLTKNDDIIDVLSHDIIFDTSLGYKKEEMNFNNAMDLYYSNSYELAYHKFIDISKKNKDNILALRFAANSLYHQDKHEEAKEIYLKILEQNENDYNAINSLGNIAIASDNAEDALLWWELAATKGCKYSAYNIENLENFIEINLDNHLKEKAKELSSEFGTAYNREATIFTEKAKRIFYDNPYRYNQKMTTNDKDDISQCFLSLIKYKINNELNIQLTKDISYLELELCSF